MTKQRCKHCGLSFMFQVSGLPTGMGSPSATHCDACYFAITEALAKIPRVVEIRWAPIELWGDRFAEITSDLLAQWEQRARETPDPAHSPFGANSPFATLVCRQIFPALFITTIDGQIYAQSSRVVHGYGPTWQNWKFRWSTWPAKLRAIDPTYAKEEILVQAEYHLPTEKWWRLIDPKVIPV